MEVPVGDVGEVTREKITYDLPELVPARVVRDALLTAAKEQLGPLAEEVVAALLAKAEETPLAPMDPTTLVLSVTPDLVPRPTSAEAVATNAAETVRAIMDQVQAMLLVLGETSPTPIETVRTTVGGNAMDVVGVLLDTVAGAIVTGAEAVPARVDSQSLSVATGDAVLSPVELATATAAATALELLPALDESLMATILVLGEGPLIEGDTATLTVALAGYANQNVATTTWTNPANALGDTTGTSASLTATASGLLGRTNNTATGAMSLGFRDVNLGDMDITSVSFNVEVSGATAGVPLTQPTVNIQYQYSLNNGSTWTTFYTHTVVALTKSVQSIDATAVVGQNQALLSALQIRATGSVTSGTGRGAGYTASFYRAWMAVQANKVYIP